MVVCLLGAITLIGVRALEVTTLNMSWSATVRWRGPLLALRTPHLIADAVDTSVLLALLSSKRFDNKRFIDVSENALYWYFVVANWLPIYAVLYLAPLF